MEHPSGVFDAGNIGADKRNGSSIFVRSDICMEAVLMDEPNESTADLDLKLIELVLVRGCGNLQLQTVECMYWVEAEAEDLLLNQYRRQ